MSALTVKNLGIDSEASKKTALRSEFRAAITKFGGGNDI